MHNMKHTVTYLLLAMLITNTLHAQDTASCPTQTNKGTDFWVMFLYNHNYNSGSHTEAQRIYILGDQTTTINISNNSTGINTTTLSAPSFFTMQYCGTNQNTVATVFDGGYHITSSNNVWVYANDYIDHNQDVALILPTTALGSRYIVQDYPSNNEQGAEVGFVATQDSTSLTMTLPCNILGTSLTAGTTLNINLNSGEAYMLMAVANGSFSGMEVTSNGKPFAMFVAGQNTAVPINGSGKDYTYEQALPVDLWGTDFIVNSPLGQSMTRLRITSSADSCTIYRNGILLTSLSSAGQTWEETLPSSSQWHITTSSPVQLVLYLGSFQTSGNNGDPSSIIIPPLDRGICDTRFVSISTPDISPTSHYVNIICHQNYTSGLLLDNIPLPSNVAVSTLGNYKCYQVPITITNANQGQHRIHNNNGTFVAYAYGLGSWESYAYPLGIALETLPYPPELIYDTVEMHDTICQGKDYTGHGFVINATHNDGLSEYWRNETFGDTLHVYHLYLFVTHRFDTLLEATIEYGDTLFFNGDTLTNEGLYSYLFTATNGCDSTVRINLLLMAVHDTIWYYDTVCQYRSYNGHGFDINGIETATAGNHEYSRIDSVSSSGGHTDSVFVYHLILTILPNTSTSQEHLIILGDTLFYNGDTLTEAGNYTYLYTAANGCDSTVTLILGYEPISLTASKDGFCPGDTITLTAGGTHAAWWSATPSDPDLQAQQGQTTVTVSPEETTTYCLLSSENGSPVECITVGVEPPPVPCVNLSVPFIDFDFPVVQFTDCSERGVTSSWTFSDGVALSGRTARRQFRHPLPDSVTVTLQNCNIYHCCSDTTFVLLTKTLSVWWPNVFTPGEGENNRFRGVFSYEVSDFELHIYNRLGLLVYHTTNPAASWDGTRNGVPVPQDTYVYHWHLRDVYGLMKSGTGTVTLIR